MDWAREMRGTSSRAKEVTPPSASAWTVASSDDGEASPTVTAPDFSDLAVAGSSGRTWARMSRSAGSRAGTVVAPACMYSWSLCPAGVPCPRLNQHVQAEPGQLLDRLRRGGHAPLTLMAFPRYAQFHPPTPLTAVCGRASGVAPVRLTGGNVAERHCFT